MGKKKSQKPCCRGIAHGSHYPIEKRNLPGPDFYNLMRRRSPQYFYAFDLLWLDGRDLRALPLRQRKQILRRMIPPQPAAVLYADHVVERGVDLFRAVCTMDLEGMVGKWQQSRYTPEQRSWVKIKNPGYSQNAGRHKLFAKRRPVSAKPPLEGRDLPTR